MSIFDAAPGGGKDDAATTPDAEDKELVQQETKSEEPQEPIAVPIPPTKLSRRAQAAEDAKKEREEDRRKFNEQISQRDAEMSRLRSELAMRPVHMVQQPAPVQQTAEPDPDELLREANKALDNKDMDLYHRKLRESHVAASQRAMAPRFAQQQQHAPQQQYDPQMIALLAQYPDVAGAPNGIQLAIVKDAELHHLGHPPGPARIQAAFAATRQTLGAGRKPAGAQYSQQAAGVLGSSPTGRGSGAAAQSGGPSLMMSADEERTARMIAKKSGMTWDEYVTDMATYHPEMVRR